MVWQKEYLNGKRTTVQDEGNNIVTLAGGSLWIKAYLSVHTRLHCWFETQGHSRCLGLGVCVGGRGNERWGGGMWVQGFTPQSG